MEIWKKAIQNVGPSVEVKSRRIGGANFQIPTEVRRNSGKVPKAEGGKNKPRAPSQARGV